MKELPTYVALVDSFRKLPGVGTRSAERMASSVLEMRAEDAFEFASAIENAANKTYTENGAVTLATTGDSCLDLFATVGALRHVSKEEICLRFQRAYAEDRDLAMKILFFARDVRGGLGERRAFRVITRWLADYAKNSVAKNIINIPEVLIKGHAVNVDLVGQLLNCNVFQALFSQQFSKALIDRISCFQCTAVNFLFRHHYHSLNCIISQKILIRYNF